MNSVSPIPTDGFVQLTALPSGRRMTPIAPLSQPGQNVAPRAPDHRQAMGVFRPPSQANTGANLHLASLTSTAVPASSCGGAAAMRNHTAVQEREIQKPKGKSKEKGRRRSAGENQGPASSQAGADASTGASAACPRRLSDNQFTEIRPFFPQSQEEPSLSLEAPSSPGSTIVSHSFPASFDFWTSGSMAMIREVFASCGDKPWHCVHPDADGHAVQSGGVYRPSAGAADVPSGCKAVVIIVSSPANEVARQMVRDFLSAEQDLPPIVVVFVGPMKNQMSPDTIMEEYDEYFGLGVDDVILGAERCTQLAVSMSLHRIERQYEVIHVLEEHEQKVQAQAKQIKLMQDRHNTLFFSCTHMLFPDLPEMQVDISGPPQTNSKLDCLALREQLGHGSFGRVWAAKDMNNGLDRAVKAIPKASLIEVEDVAGVANEVRMLSRVQGHCNVVSFLGVIHAKDHMYLIMETVGGANLFRKIKSAGGTLPADVVRCYSGQIADGIAYCISNSVAHRDLKPENVVVSENSSLVKIVDFGCAVSLRQGKLHQGVCGTMPFMGPEVMCGGKYDPSKVDSWAWALLVVEMTIGVSKFGEVLGWPRKVPPSPGRAADLESWLNTPNFIGGQLLPHAPVEPPSMDALVEVLEGALTVDPRARWSAQDIADCRWLHKD